MIILLAIFFLPFILTIWNIVAALIFLIEKEDARGYKYVEVAAILTGVFYLCIAYSFGPYGPFAATFGFWPPRITDYSSFPITLTLSIVAFAGYVLVRYIPVVKQHLIVSVIGIATIYLGIGICVLWCIQAYNDEWLQLYLANVVIIFLKTIYIQVCQENILIQSQTVTLKNKGLTSLLYKASSLPRIKLLFVIPLYIIIGIMQLYVITTIMCDLFEHMGLL